jgi:DNA-binding PadR family transcriptional regulator
MPHYIVDRKRRTHMPLPAITFLQWLVLEIIGGSTRSGKYVRDRLAERGHRKSLPAFYQMMSRLEDAGFVRAESVRATVCDQTVTERHYRLMVKGIRELADVRDFQAGLEIARSQGRQVSHG